jgi:hypothetical protein
MTINHETRFKPVHLSTHRPMEASSRIGHEEARLGLPFDPDRFVGVVDPDDVARCQGNYERARLRVVQMRAEGRMIPKMTPTGRAPKALMDWLRRLRPHDWVSPLPTGPLADDPDLAFPHGSTLDRRGFPRPVPTFTS